MTPLRFVGAPDSPHNPNPADHQVRTPKCRPAALRTTNLIGRNMTGIEVGEV